MGVILAAIFMKPTTIRKTPNITVTGSAIGGGCPALASRGSRCRSAGSRAGRHPTTGPPWSATVAAASPNPRPAWATGSAGPDSRHSNPLSWRRIL